MDIHLSPQITIPDNVKNFNIGKDGTVTATDPQTSATIDLGQITIADFINPKGLNVH